MASDNVAACVFYIGYSCDTLCYEVRKKNRNMYCVSNCKLSIIVIYIIFMNVVPRVQRLGSINKNNDLRILFNVDMLEKLHHYVLFFVQIAPTSAALFPFSCSVSVRFSLSLVYFLHKELLIHHLIMKMIAIAL